VFCPTGSALHSTECLQMIFSVGLSAIHVDIAEQNCKQLRCKQQPRCMTVAGKELVNLLTKQGSEMSFVISGMSVKVGRSRRL